MTTPKLEPGTPLPCPFCDGPVEEFHEEVDIGVGIQHGPSHHHCLCCEAQWGDYRDWPTRHPDPRQQEKIEALVKAGDEMFRWLDRCSLDPYAESAVRDFKRTLAALAEAK